MSDQAGTPTLQRYTLWRRHLIGQARARRAGQIDRVVDALSIALLFGTMGYMLVGDRPFQPDLLAASEISPINRWAWLALFAVSLPILWRRWRDVVRLVPAIWPIVLLHLWFCASTTWALDPASSTRRAVVTCLALVICVAITVGLRRPERWHLLACIPAMLVMVVDLASWAVVPGVAMTPLGLEGLHAQKNVLGMYAMFTVILGATSVWGARPGWPRRLLAAGVVAAAIALLASRSSTSIAITFGAAVVLPGLVWLLRRTPIFAAAGLLGLLLIIIGGLSLYIMWCGVAGADPLAPLAGVTLTKRTDLWAFIIDNIHKRPLGGAGFGSFWAIDKGLQPSLNSGLWFGTGKNIAPEGHDAYLDLAAATGWPGLAMGVFVVLRAIAWGAGAVHAAPRGMALPSAAFSLGYCLMIAGHSATESTLFSPNSSLGTLFILTAVSLEWARLQAAAPRHQARQRPDVPAMPPAPAHR